MIVAISTLAALPACRRSAIASTGSNARPTPPTPDEIRARTERSFAKAILAKPKETDADELLRALAPLFMVELPEDASPNEQDYTFEYAPSLQASMTASVEVTSVFFDRSPTSIQGRSFDQVLFLSWRWRRTGQGNRFQKQSLFGLRATLSADGFPLTWEVLDDDGLDTIYVSRKLEDETRLRFGDPLPGRVFSVERGIEDAPETVVARVFEDGPIPMGAYLYLRHGDHAASTLLCRCSPAQVEQVVFTKPYSLQPVETLGDEWRAWRADIDLAPLDTRLRWPYP